MKETVKDLRPAAYNPRKISPKALESLGKAMREYGDLSGIVFNQKTGNVVGGHQRIKHLDPSWEIKKSPAKDSTGTIAIGYIETPMGRWQYREVDWDESKEKAANVAANKHGGEWDLPLLKEILIGLDDGNFDLTLTGFDEKELKNLIDYENKNEGIDAGKTLFEIIISCENEVEQEKNFNKLQSEGYVCRILTL